MSAKPRILCLTDAEDGQSEVPQLLDNAFDVVEVNSPVQALSLLRDEVFTGLYVLSDQYHDGLELSRLLQNQQILEGMPDGVALLDTQNQIVWANQQMSQWCKEASVLGANFYGALHSPTIEGPDFCPLRTALTSGQASGTSLKCDDGQILHIHAAPLLEEDGTANHLIVTIRDVTVETLQHQKLESIHRAGIELADLAPDELLSMDVEDRKELLKSNILHHTQHLLNFKNFEIRLLHESTGELEPLLSYGIDAEASCRQLIANPQNNGVTGFVASSAKSYLCEDTQADPLYIQGMEGAKSSLTVPLLWHDKVIGTFNVESHEPRAFDESDLQFLEIYARDLAMALNTFELLTVQQANAAQRSVDAIHSAVALPVDVILNEACNVMERYIGHEPEVVERLTNILKNAREVKQVIYAIGQSMAPAQAVSSAVQFEQRPKLVGRRVLVADNDDDVREQAHNLLERYGCVVETAHDGAEAVGMVRISQTAGQYDAIIADIQLPDMSGYELLLKLKDLLDPVPLILMTGFGYDPGHSIVKARQAGLPKGAVLYKPFRLDQLLETVENIVDPPMDAND